MRQPRKLQHLTGYSLQARDGEIGTLEQVYFDDERWAVRYFVVRTGGWLLGRRVLIAPAAVSGVDETGRSLIVELTREQVRDSPPVDERAPVSRHYEREYYRYYGWQPYWVGDPWFGPAPVTPPPVPSEQPQEPEHPHLRSSKEVTGYRIGARDGEIGQVVDLILEEPEWIVRYLEVDTRGWLPGKHVLVAPAWIEAVDWAKAEVRVELARQAIETAPPYDPAKVIDRDDQVALYGHYGKQLEAD